MSPAAVANFINPSPILNFRKFNDIHQKTPFSGPAFRTLKESAIVHRKSFRLTKTMAGGSIETRIVSGGDGDRITPAVPAFEHEPVIDNGGRSFHQTVGGLHTFLNRVSRWVTAVPFGAFILVRHDGISLWAAMGSVVNVILSITLKQILKQERPDSKVSYGHGMPSSHAQTIFFALVFQFLLVVKWHGFNGVTAILGMLLVALGSYFSWLRVLFCYHTTSQVVVGAIVGSILSILHYWAWESIVDEAHNSSLWVRIVVIVGVAFFCLGLMSELFNIGRKIDKDQ